MNWDSVVGQWAAGVFFLENIEIAPYHIIQLGYTSYNHISISPNTLPPWGSLNRPAGYLGVLLCFVAVEYL